MPSTAAGPIHARKALERAPVRGRVEIERVDRLRLSLPFRERSYQFHGVVLLPGASHDTDDRAGPFVDPSSHENRECLHSADGRPAEIAMPLLRGANAQTREEAEGQRGESKPPTPGGNAPRREAVARPGCPGPSAAPVPAGAS